MKSLVKVLVYLFGSLIILGASQCDPRHTGNLKKSKYNIKQVISNSKAIEFNHVKELVLDTSCIKCHSPGNIEGDLDLSTYDSLINRKAEVVSSFYPSSSLLYKVIISKGKRKMPPTHDARLSEEQIRLVYLWIENGAVYKKENEAAAPVSLKNKLLPYFERPETIDYKTLQQFVFKKSCFSCHSEAGHKTEEDTLVYSADLTSYKSIFNPFNTVVKKGLPSQSSIYKAVAITQSMPSAVDGYDPLDSLLIKLMRLWILNCAIETYNPADDDLMTSNPDTPDKVRLCENQN